MATINILSLKEYFRKFNTELNAELRGNVPRKVKASILSEMNRGKSPTRGKRWVKYSESYDEAIRSGRYSRYRKSPRPVNLKLKGDLHKSLDVKYINKTLKIEFKDEKAKWHDEGKGRLPIRRLLPNDGETFNGNIQKVFDMSIKRLVKKYF